jgi:hypothetical protein
MRWSAGGFSLVEGPKMTGLFGILTVVLMVF